MKKDPKVADKIGEIRSILGIFDEGKDSSRDSKLLKKEILKHNDKLEDRKKKSHTA